MQDLRAHRAMLAPRVTREHRENAGLQATRAWQVSRERLEIRGPLDPRERRASGALMETKACRELRACRVLTATRVSRGLPAPSEARDWWDFWVKRASPETRDFRVSRARAVTKDRQDQLGPRDRRATREPMVKLGLWVTLVLVACKVCQGRKDLPATLACRVIRGLKATRV